MTASPASSAAQWLTLTGRITKQMTLRGELVLTVVSSVVFTVGLYLPMRYVMESVHNIDYGQYVIAIIVLQAVAAGMIASSQRAALENKLNFTDRLRSMPVSPLMIFCSRLTAALYRGLVAMVSSVAIGYLIGFRLQAGPAQTALFVGFILLIGLVLSIIAELAANLSSNQAALSHATTLPIILLGILSTGFVPEQGFPEPLRPFVRNQPVSQFAETLRAMTTTGITLDQALPSLLWLGCTAAIALPIAVWTVQRRR